MISDSPHLSPFHCATFYFYSKLCLFNILLLLWQYMLPDCYNFLLFSTPLSTFMDIHWRWLRLHVPIFSSSHSYCLNLLESSPDLWKARMDAVCCCRRRIHPPCHYLLKALLVLTFFLIFLSMPQLNRNPDFFENPLQIVSTDLFSHSAYYIPPKKFLKYSLGSKFHEWKITRNPTTPGWPHLN